MTQKHIHKVIKRKYKNGSAVYQCILPDCFFKVESWSMLGKETICHQCGNSFQMNEYTIRLTRPHCSSCGRRAAKDESGKTFYVNKRLKNPEVLTTIAADEVSNLRDRLNSLTGEDDI